MSEQNQQQNRYPLLSESVGKDLYYDKKVNRWTHVHVNVLPNGVRNLIFYDGHLVRIAQDKVQCETCERIFLLTPPPFKWDSQREKRVDEVLSRLRETDHPKAWECPSKTPGDGRIYQILFNDLVHQWECTCRDYRDYADRFWKCKHVRAVERKIASFSTDHQTRPEVTKTPDAELLPVGRPIKGNGWRGTLLTRCKGGVAYLEVQGVIHTAPHQQIWAEISKRGFEVADDCVWIDIAYEMGREGEK